MKVLSVKQPWALAIMHLGKDVENRTWPTGVRGRVAIHASAKLSVEDWLEAECVLADLRNRGYSMLRLPAARVVEGPRGGLRFLQEPAGIVCGAILGTVEIADCVTQSASPWFFGPYGFVLRDPQPFEHPVLTRGRQGWWDWECAA